ncbi:MAG: hypothetical protein GXY86_11735 [Firmicutes bacterium]|nr:hypothetical protein [Bacillota bacterium]
MGSISILSEIEPDCWGRVQKRLMGSNSFKQARESYKCPAKFPSVFTSWRDYRDYLFEALVPEEQKPVLAGILAKCNKYMDTDLEMAAIRAQIDSILICDVAGVLVGRFVSSHSISETFGRAGQDAARKLEDSKADGAMVVHEVV